MVILRRQEKVRDYTNRQGNPFLFDAPISVLPDNLSDRAHLLTTVVLLDADPASVDHMVILRRQEKVRDYTNRKGSALYPISLSPFFPDNISDNGLTSSLQLSCSTPITSTVSICVVKRKLETIRTEKVTPSIRCPYL